MKTIASFTSKLLAFTLALMAGMTSCERGNEYPPEPHGQPQWCDTWNVLYTNSSLGPDEQETTWRYQLTHDTVIGEQTYTLLQGYCTAYPEALHQVGMVRRSNDRKVYAYCNGQEYLVYDFSVKVGNQLEVLIGIDSYNKTQQCLVHNVSTDTEGRTVVTLYVYDAYLGEYNTDDYAALQWIEGVGSKRGFFLGQEIGLDGAGATHLLCAWHGDECLYTTDHHVYQSYDCEYNDEVTE